MSPPVSVLVPTLDEELNLPVEPFSEDHAWLEALALDEALFIAPWQRSEIHIEKGAQSSCR